jgi:Flp pilus assembly pilin Flp
VTNLVIRIHAAISGLLRKEEGQDLLEYALLGGLIAAGIVAVLAIMTGNISDMVNNIGDCIDFASSTPCNPGF